MFLKFAEIALHEKNQGRVQKLVMGMGANFQILEGVPKFQNTIFCKTHFCEFFLFFPNSPTLFRSCHPILPSPFSLFLPFYPFTYEEVSEV